MTDYGLLLSPLSYLAELIRSDADQLRRHGVSVDVFPSWQTKAEADLEKAEAALMAALAVVREKRAVIAQMEREAA